MDLVRAAEFGEIPADVRGLNCVAVEGYGGGEGRYEPESCLCAHGDRMEESSRGWVGVPTARWL